MVDIKTVDNLLEEARFRNSFKLLPKGKTYKNLSTIIVVPIVLNQTSKETTNCPKCNTKIEYEKNTFTGLHPVVVESWKRLVKPMNVPILEMMATDREVGDAYQQAIETILSNPSLSKFKYILTMETDNIVPYMPDTQGPLMSLYECMEKGYDVAGGLYWTKSTPSMPLIYGEPTCDIDDSEGFFKVIHNFEEGSIVECNGLGMGFTLFKMDIFKDKRLKKPYFKTLNAHTREGIAGFTQDLFFFKKIRKLGYKVCVDTRVKLGHMDLNTGVIY